VSGHSLIAFPHPCDLELIADAGATVAHSPPALARRGVMLEDFQRYLDHGINVSIGTDSYPQDMLTEMQYASMLGKLATKNHEAASTADVFTAATLGGAKALRRDGLGRLCPCAKADIVIVDFTNPRAGPVFDPIKALLRCGTSDLVDHLIVDGVTVVENGEVRAWGTEELLTNAQVLVN
jgi:5-methylthioadenosine/S-adenosylhomocysteine deaminase